MIQAKKSDTKIVAHARRELEMAGLFTANKQNDYDGFIGKGSLALIKLFDDWTHDDVARMQAVHSVFNFLVGGDLLSPPTNDPDEWEDVKVEEQTITRNKRNNMYITRDGRKTWFNLRTEQRGVCNDIKTGKPLEGVRDPNGSTKVNKDTEGSADAGNGGHGVDPSTVAPGTEVPSTEGEPSPAEPRGENDSPVEDGKLDAGVEPKGKAVAPKKKTAKKKPQTGEK